MGHLQEPSCELDEVVFNTLVAQYEQVGNSLALQYGGSELANTVKTYTKVPSPMFLGFYVIGVNGHF